MDPIPLRTYPEPCLQELPKELRGIVIDYLGKKTMVAVSVRVMKGDGTIVGMHQKRPLLPCERIAYITGFANLKSDDEENFHYPHILFNNDPSVLPIQNHPRLAWMRDQALSVQTKSHEELVTLATRCDAPLPPEPENLDSSLVSWSYDPGLGTFTVPSLTELLIRGRLPNEFIALNKDFIEDNEVQQVEPTVVVKKLTVQNSEAKSDQ